MIVDLRRLFMNIKTIMSVAIGGFLGGITRYELSALLGGAGILYANLIGSFLLAFITYYFIERGLLAAWLNAGIGTGFIGAFTTFSSLATTIVKLESQGIIASVGYFLVSSLGGLALALLGFMLARKYGGSRQDD
ncbi:camphor resistance protein CrcB [Limosilactobacillus reuteri]|uniref:Fluoride-specific ion channel FluC n=2 Tax=Limosilactobacillus reuteri TaxID=1598 RepID=A0AB73QJ40_LIMRT|nr:camphor resistance protein CrcB [Limosilactobacillus reuteri]OYS90327.1 camphor resistance protein CrcB [Limosilactobacillus reuteri]OYS93462.1 camphor resistance protein CrcB [Limosilactobacillus reuteri]OYS94822.1 camphor resistance protein CrcB [Limosilactobacillus reuteri]OYS96746.1 camphor resistance protein CrcB [Limosilactobacillus reuteri]